MQTSPDMRRANKSILGRIISYLSLLLLSLFLLASQYLSFLFLLSQSLLCMELGEVILASYEQLARIGQREDDEMLD